MTPAAGQKKESWPPIVALVGSTGAGKSALALAAKLQAELGGGDIVCCDSVQVYCGFDIGSATPMIICGGTGLYLQALRRNLLAVPAADATLRGEILAEEVANPGSLHRRLAKLDPASAAQLSANNPAHLLRTLEIALLIGQAPSHLRAQHAAQGANIPMHVVVVDRDTANLRAHIVSRAIMKPL